MKINKTSLILATILSATANAEGYYICIPCEKGEYEKDGKCTPCPAGSYSNLNAQSQCTPCPAGTYQPNKGQTNCITCPAGNACPYGSANPQYCDGNAGYWAPAGSGSCNPCVKITGRGTTGDNHVTLDWNTWYYHNDVCKHVNAFNVYDDGGWWLECHMWPISEVIGGGWKVENGHLEYRRDSWSNGGRSRLIVTCGNTTGYPHMVIERDGGEGWGTATIDVRQ